MLSQSQAEAAVEVTLTYYAFGRSIGGAFASTIRCSDCCARSGDARAWSALSGMGSRHSILPRPGCVMSPARHGPPSDISTSDC